MNTDKAFIEFVKMPRGTYRWATEVYEIDLWQFVEKTGEKDYRYTIWDKSTKVFVKAGFIPTTNLDYAIEETIRAFYLYLASPDLPVFDNKSEKTQDISFDLYNHIH